MLKKEVVCDERYCYYDTEQKCIIVFGGMKNYGKVNIIKT